MPVDTATLRRMIAEELPSLREFRHDLHRHPEIAYEERRTSQRVQAELTKAGVEFRAGMAGGTGILATLGPQGGPSVGLRADMDALPIEEETGLPYCSTIPGRMHACGHDGHTTILVGTARVLARLARQAPLPRPVSLVFQPAEEGGAGAARMIEDGCLDANGIERIYALHGWPSLPVGAAATRTGPLLASADRLDIRIEGVGVHAAFPHAGTDTVVAAAAVVLALQTVVSRRVPPTEAAVVSVAMIHGGTAGNVLPQRVDLCGTIRALTQPVRHLLHHEVERIAKATALAHGCTAAVSFTEGYPVTLNHPDATDDVRRAVGATLGQPIIEAPSAVMGAEDFAYYGHRIPACMFVLGIRDPAKDSMPELHSPRFDFNDAALPLGIEAFCRLALETP